MLKYISTPHGLATPTGAGILAAATNTNVMATGGYFTSHAALVVALSVGVFAGARVIGAGVAGTIAAAIIIALGAGEIYNLSATAERTVIERENGAAPLKDALAKHNAALAKLNEIESSKVGSARLSLALDNQAKARASYDLELRTGGRCKQVCNGLKDDAAKADAEVSAAAEEAQRLHAANTEAAKADVAASPLPASATPLADRLGLPAWALDLIMAGLLSVGANGLAGTLIAFGAHSTIKEDLPVAQVVKQSLTTETPVIDTAGQSSFPPVRSAEIDAVMKAMFAPIPEPHSADILTFVHPNNPPPNNSPNGPKPGKRASVKKADVLSDIRGRIDSGERFASQEELRAKLIERFGYIGRSTLSDWLGEMESEVERTTVGRRKMIG